MNKKLLVVLFAAGFGFSGVQAPAFADECPDRSQTNEQTNAKFLNEGIALADEALEHARQGHGPETKEGTKAALAKLKCIVTTTAGAQLQGPKGKITLAGIKAGKGDLAAAIPLLEAGIAGIKNVNMTPRGLGE